jgi:hypothetical protein
VFETERECYQVVLSTVHASIKMVSAAIKGFEAMSGEFEALVRQVRYMHKEERGREARVVSGMGALCCSFHW